MKPVHLDGLLCLWILHLKKWFVSCAHTQKEVSMKNKKMRKTFGGFTFICLLCPCSLAEVSLSSGIVGGKLYIEKAYLTLCAWHIEIWQFQLSVKHQSNKDVHQVYIHDTSADSSYGLFAMLPFIYSCVGFSVARSTDRACQSLNVWDEWQKTLTHFLYINQTLSQSAEFESRLA